MAWIRASRPDAGLLTCALALLGACLAAPGHAATSPPCDRACLEGVLGDYLAAVFHHDPGAAPLAGTHRATENGAPLAAGQALWQSLTGYGPVGRRFADPQAGQVAYFGQLREGDDTVVASVRLKVVDRRATEAEWTVARARYGTMFQADGLERDPPPADRVLPPGERVPREQMVAAADAYFEGLQRHDGSAVPRIEGCERVENGLRVTHSALHPGPPPATTPGSTAAPAGAPASAPATTPSAAQEALSGDCTAGFEGFAHSIASTDLRRFPLVDEQAGVVMGTTLFHRPPGSTLRRNLLTEFFYERGGRIEAIYAAMYYLPPDAADGTGW